MTWPTPSGENQTTYYSGTAGYTCAVSMPQAHAYMFGAPHGIPAASQLDGLLGGMEAARRQQRVLGGINQWTTQRRWQPGDGFEALLEELQV